MIRYTDRSELSIGNLKRREPFYKEILQQGLSILEKAVQAVSITILDRGQHVGQFHSEGSGYAVYALLSANFVKLTCNTLFLFSLLWLTLSIVGSRQHVLIILFYL